MPKLTKTPIYTQREDRSIDKRKQDWWIGIYTNENCYDGRTRLSS